MYRPDRLHPIRPSPAGQKAHLYNVTDVLVQSPYIVVCEGELDTVITSGMVGIPAVGVPGVQAWKPHFAKLFNGYDTVFIAADNDLKEDGSNPGMEFAKRISSEIMNSTIVSLPAGLDITDYYLANGYDTTRSLFGL